MAHVHGSIKAVVEHLVSMVLKHILLKVRQEDLHKVFALFMLKHVIFTTSVFALYLGMAVKVSLDACTA